ncbi:MAG: tetratricopeptide repeat protein [Dactylosporangium sp.]|nr:tetratricopeptide repeat protein [Dactylosporangium sp.]
MGGAAGRTSGGTRSAVQAGLGAGLVDLPRIPLPDPTLVVLADPQVPESRRFCARCSAPVGRGRDGRPGLVEGFCARDGVPFSFAPRLRAGEVVGERYEVIGCLAYGGLGWIYLARDLNLGDGDRDHIVVLKGLIDTGDADALDAAVAERRFLVEVDHHGIVRIHDFVSHRDSRTGTTVGYIVMEYVGGRSLRELLLGHRDPDGRRTPLPLEQVLAYALEILPALGYLHDRSLVYCDFKPDNVMHTEDRLKLIDLGAVCRAGDTLTVVWGTVGYQAPEVAGKGPSVPADLYTVGRTMAVLSLDFPGFTTTSVDRLPAPRDAPLLARQESYHRLLRRATHRDPARRFESAADMGEHVLGVLRQVLAAADGVPRPAISTLFTSERRAFGTEAGVIGPGDATREDHLTAVPSATAIAEGAVEALPVPQVDLADPGTAFLATVQAADPAELLEILDNAPRNSMEVHLRRARARIATGELATALQELDELAGSHPLDWRITWYQGMAALAAGRFADARAAFDTVYDALPGELAAQLALAVAAEGDGDRAAAEGYYGRVWRTDRSYLSAAFGLARILVATDRAAEAIAVLDDVPEHSARYVFAQVAAIRARIRPGQRPLERAALLDAATRIERLDLDAERRAVLTTEILRAALRWVAARPGNADSGRVGDSDRVLRCDLAERPLRCGLEQTYRVLARFAPDAGSRIALVDTANALRPRTWT